MDAGIYKITNLVNGKCYIGKSKNLQLRLGNHRSMLKHNKHYNLHLQRSYNLYGVENFKFEVIKYLPDDSQLSYWEEYYIEQTHSFDPSKGYNKERYSNKVRILTEETKKKMSLLAKNRDYSNYGLKHTKIKSSRNTTGEGNITYSKNKKSYYISFRYKINNTKKRLRLYHFKDISFAVLIRDIFYCYSEASLMDMKTIFQSIKYDDNHIFKEGKWYCELKI